MCQSLDLEWVPYHPKNNNDDDNTNEEHGIQILPKCTLYVHIELREVIPAGDHDMCLVQVTNISKWDNDLCQALPLMDDGTIMAFDSDSALYTGQLRMEGII